MIDKTKKILYEIAFWTAVPANLLAILPFILKLFDYDGFSIDVQVQTISIPSISITFGRDPFIVMVVYSVIAFMYWLAIRINTNRGIKKFNSLRMFSIGIPLFFGLPFSSILIVFRSLPQEIGLIIFLLWIIIGVTTFFSWKATESIFYKDIGLWYLALIPIVWLFFQQINPTNWPINLGLAWVYSAIAYLLSGLFAGLTILFFILPISHTGLTKTTFRLFLHYYLFGSDRGYAVSGTLVIFLAIGVLALILGLVVSFFTFLFWLLSLLPLVLLALLIWGYYLASNKRR